jgi:hypothetical protein
MCVLSRTPAWPLKDEAFPDRPDRRPVLEQRCCSAGAGDPISWLGRISNAAHKLNYTGSFTYQSGKNIETSRIAHFVDANGDEHERLEALDGSPGRLSAIRRKCSASFRTRSC